MTRLYPRSSFKEYLTLGFLSNQVEPCAFASIVCQRVIFIYVLFGKNVSHLIITSYQGTIIISFSLSTAVLRTCACARKTNDDLMTGFKFKVKHLRSHKGGLSLEQPFAKKILIVASSNDFSSSPLV